MYDYALFIQCCCHVEATRLYAAICTLLTKTEKMNIDPGFKLRRLLKSSKTKVCIPSQNNGPLSSNSLMGEPRLRELT